MANGTHPKSYSRFSKKDIKKLGITVREAMLFSQVKPLQPSEWLTQTLDQSMQIKLGSEKAKSEFIIAPIMREIIERNPDQIALFSGYEFTVLEEKGLTGSCDYIFSRDVGSPDIQAPVLLVVEAKNENLETGGPQCIAEMYAAQLFNEQAGKPPRPVYGAVTFGREWQFYCLTNQTVVRDVKIFSITELPLIIGVLQQIIEAEA